MMDDNGFNQRPETLGQDHYLLTNPDGSLPTRKVWS